MTPLLAFIRKLREQKIYFSIDSVRDEAVMVRVDVPGERWEVEFFENGEVEIEIFRSDGKISGEYMLTELFRRHGES